MPVMSPGAAAPPGSSAPLPEAASSDLLGPALDEPLPGSGRLPRASSSARMQAASGTASRRRPAAAARSANRRGRNQQVLIVSLGVGALVFVVAVVAMIAGPSGWANHPPATKPTPDDSTAQKPPEVPKPAAGTPTYAQRLASLSTPAERLARVDEWLASATPADRQVLRDLREEVVEQVAMEDQRRLDAVLEHAREDYENGRLDAGDRAIAAWIPIHDPDGSWRERALADGQRMRRAVEWGARRDEIEKAIGEGRLDDASAAIDELGRLAEVPGARVAIEGWRTRLLEGEAAAGANRRRDALAAAVRAGTGPGRERVEQARKDVATRREAARAIAESLSRGMVESTRLKPFDLPLSKTYTIEEARLLGFDGEQLRVSWPNGEVSVVLARLRDREYEAVLTRGLKGAGGREHLHVGKMFLRRRLFKAADQCFEAARKADPTLGPIIPDLDRIRAAERIFKGRYEVLGNSLSLAWDLENADEAEDFESEGGPEGVVVEGGQLIVRGPQMAMATARAIPFRDRIRAAAVPGRETRSAHLLGMAFTRPDGTPVQILAVLSRESKAFTALRVVGQDMQELIEPREFQEGAELAMDFDRGRFVFRVGTEKLYEGWEGGFTDVQVAFGAMGMSGQAEAGFDSIRIEGRVAPLWIRKKTDEYRDVLASELARENRVDRTSAEETSSIALSTDPALGDLEAEQVRQFEGARGALEVFHRDRNVVTFLSARQSIDAFVVGWPEFAPGLYLQAQLDEQVGEFRNALEGYERALVHLPDFPEALVASAALRAILGKWEDAGARVERAMAIRPDLPEAHILAAQLAFRKGDRAAALDESDLAEALAPTDGRIKAEARMMANVARGPQWDRPNVAETEHYRVASDLPKDKVQHYAQHLEAVRPYYAEMLGRTASTVEKSSVLIFDTEEGYHLYGEISAGDRFEDTLGLYSPQYSQLMLYEDADLEETLGTLYHEGFHQYFHCFGWGGPIWINEGMAEYVSGVLVKDGKLLKTGLVLKGRLLNLKAALQYGWEPVPFSRIMNESQIEFYGQDPSLRYAQAWSMVHYFIHGSGGKYRRVLVEYVSRLVDGATGDDAYAATFGKEDVEAMEREWRKYVDALKP